MFTITAGQLSNNTVSVQAEAKGASEAEIICAYKALAEVVDGMKVEKEGGEK